MNRFRSAPGGKSHDISRLFLRKKKSIFHIYFFSAPIRLSTYFFLWILIRWGVFIYLKIEKREKHEYNFTENMTNEFFDWNSWKANEIKKKRIFVHRKHGKLFQLLQKAIFILLFVCFLFISAIKIQSVNELSHFHFSINAIKWKGKWKSLLICYFRVHFPKEWKCE